MSRVTGVARRVKARVFRNEGVVLLFCPRISDCRCFCSTYRKYLRQGYDIVCLNSSFYKVDDVDKVLKEELRRRNELKNRLGF